MTTTDSPYCVVTRSIAVMRYPHSSRRSAILTYVGVDDLLVFSSVLRSMVRLAADVASLGDIGVELILNVVKVVEAS